MLAGFIIGNAVASSASRPPPRSNYASPGQDTYALNREREARHQAELRERELAAQAALAEQAKDAPQPVTIPSGVFPGQTFMVKYQGSDFSLSCPPNLGPGGIMYVAFPRAAPVVAVPAAVATADVVPMASLGREVLFSAVSSSGSSSSSSSSEEPNVICSVNHIVDDPAARVHNIISMYEGETARLIGGSLETGLDPPYQDYCLIKKADGQQGRVSRFVLKRFKS